MMKTFNKKFFLAIVLTAAIPLTLSADYQKSFLDGIKAQGLGDWAKMANKMNEAIAEQPAEGGKVLSGMIPYDYLPHYYLGLAYYKSANYSAALEQFAESERQGKVRAVRSLYATMTEMQQAAVGKGGSVPAQVAGNAPTQPKNPQKQPEKPPAEKQAEKAAAQERPTRNVTAMSEAIKKAQGEVDRASDAANAFTAFRDRVGNAALWERDAELRAQHKEAVQKLLTAGTKLDAAVQNQDLPTISEAGDLATASARELAALRSSLQIAGEKAAEQLKFAEQQKIAEQQKLDQQKVAAQQQLAEQERLQQLQREKVDDQQREQLARSIAQRVSTAKRTVAVIAGQKRVRQLEQPGKVLTTLLNRASTVGAKASPADLAKLVTDLDSAIRNATRLLETLPGVAGSGPPPSLFDAVSAFFSSDYQRTASVLSTVEFPDPRARGQAYLFRSAARFALYVRGGEKDSKLLDSVIADIRECRRNDASATPLARAFSPRFVTLFKLHS